MAAAQVAVGPLDGETPITVRVDGQLVAQFYPVPGVPIVELAIRCVDRLIASGVARSG